MRLPRLPNTWHTGLVGDSESDPGHADWRAWLDASASVSFRFDGGRGKFSARRELRRRGQGYWYAYRKHHGKLSKVYLGRTADLTLERLETVAAALSEQRGRGNGSWRGLPGGAHGAGNLPPERTSFVGRARDVADISQLVHDRRLVTLSGAGGVGKTRLALRVAQAVQSQYRDGVWLVPMAALDDAELVPQAVARVLGVAELPGQPLIQSVVAELVERNVLLIFDNCEHVVEACAELTQAVLQRCPGISVLVTSREPLRVAGERVWLTSPLRLPDTGQAPAESEAVQLFVDRAAAAQSGFSLTTTNAEVVTRICRRLDGVPLALELAAARVRTLSIDQIAARLDDLFRLLTKSTRTAPPRQQTLRQTLDWSYQLLSPSEQDLLVRLAVFAGEFEVGAVEAVAAINRQSAVELLTQLGDRSLVVVDGNRYRLLETTRQYASDELRNSGNEPPLRTRHRDWCLALAEEAVGHLRGPDQATWLARLETEHDNLRTALEWTIQQRNGDVGRRFGVALWRFWYVRGHYAEGHRWLDELLRLPGAADGGADHALLLFGLGQLAFEQADFATARASGQESLALGRALGDGMMESAALTLLGNVARGEGDFSRARHFYEQGLEIRERSAQRADQAISLGALGHVALALGEHAQARDYYARALAIGRELGQHKDVANLLYRLGETAVEQGAVPEARKHYRESLALAQKLGDRQRVAFALEGFASVAAVERRPSRAVALAGAAAALRNAIRSPLSDSDGVWFERRLVAARAALGHEAARWFDHGFGLPVSEAVRLAFSPAEPVDTALELPPLRGITPREQQVAALVARGLSNRKIAEQLGVAQSTIQRHIVNILSKLHLESRVQIALWVVTQRSPQTRQMHLAD